MENVVEIVILFVCFSYHSLKIHLRQLSEKALFPSVFYFLGLRDTHFPEIRFFCLLELWGIPFIKSGKSNKLCYCQ